MYSMLSAGLADASTAMKSLAQLASGLSAGLADASMAMKPLAQLAEEYVTECSPWCCGEAVPHNTRQHGCALVRVVGQ